MFSLGAPSFTPRPNHDAVAAVQLNRMLAARVPEGAFTQLAHLLAAEERMDELDALGTRNTEYLSLRSRAQSYIEENPSLLDGKWIRNAGAVYDLIDAERNRRLDLASQYC